MPTRDSAPTGAPCWADLWTSDVDASRRFYAELFGWEALEPAPEFGGYFMFARGGAPVAGGMGDMGDMKADNRWKVYLATPDINAATAKVVAAGGVVVFPPVPVADMGIQAVVIDPTGATVGLWQPGTFQGFAALDEPGAPSWFELHANDYDKAIKFYRETTGWETDVMGDGGGFRYSMAHEAGSEVAFAGVYDASADLAAGGESSWVIYWSVEDVDATVAKLRALGGGVSEDAADTPYGRVASVTDTTGAPFRLIRRP